jgi:hypothetical protein
MTVMEIKTINGLIGIKNKNLLIMKLILYFTPNKTTAKKSIANSWGGRMSNRFSSLRNFHHKPSQAKSRPAVFGNTMNLFAGLAV